MTALTADEKHQLIHSKPVYLEASGSILKQAAGLSRVVIENKTIVTYANLCQCLQTRAHLTIVFFGKSWKIANIISSESDIQ